MTTTVVQVNHKNEIHLVDRGGLKHVTNMAYSLLVSMEMELRSHLQGNAVPVDSVTEAISTNKNVFFSRPCLLPNGKWK